MDALRTRTGTLDRRRFLTGVAGASVFFLAPGAYAEQLVRTPRLTEGPFYPDHLPLDSDNDLLVINDALTPASGQVTHLGGRILDRSGEPVRNAQVEIWQADANGVYIHSRSHNPGLRDPHFQGYGRFETGSTGEYGFRTIRPVEYPGRAPHIHFAVQAPRRDKFITQVHVEGEPSNERDRVLGRIRDAETRASVIVPFVPAPDSAAGELAARFDIVLDFNTGV